MLMATAHHTWWNLDTCFCCLSGCSGLIRLDVAMFQWGLPEGTDPDPFLAFLVIIKAARLFSYKHTIRERQVSHCLTHNFVSADDA